MRVPSLVGAHAHHHVVAEAEDRRARDRLDDAVARRRPRRSARVDRTHALPCGGRASTMRHLRLVMTFIAAS